MAVHDDLAFRGEDPQPETPEAEILRLRDELHTEPARDLAAERHAFVETFYERFLAEWHGEA